MQRPGRTRSDHVNRKDVVVAKHSGPAIRPLARREKSGVLLNVSLFARGQVLIGHSIPRAQLGTTVRDERPHWISPHKCPARELTSSPKRLELFERLYSSGGAHIKGFHTIFTCITNG